MNDFAFNPPTGLRDVTAYPSEPVSEAAARDQFQGLLDQVKTFFNSDIKTALADLTNTASLGASGWFKDKKTGLILQWATASVTFTAGMEWGTTITLPIAFPSNFYRVFNTVSPATANDVSNVTAKKSGLTGVTINAKNGTTGQIIDFNIFAIGN